MDSPNVQKSPIPIQMLSPLELQKAERARRISETNDLAGDFEAMLVLQVIRSVESQLENGSLFGSDRVGDVFGGFAEWEIARAISRSANLGLRDQLLEQLQPREDQQK